MDGQIHDIIPDELLAKFAGRKNKNEAICLSQLFFRVSISKKGHGILNAFKQLTL
jgi:hypothetical protein